MEAPDRYVTARRPRHTGAVAENRVQAFFRQRRRKDEQLRQAVQAQHLDSVNQLASLSDAELIATDHSIPSVTHQMEMSRRLKVAITELTKETVTARKSSERVGRLLILLTAVLVALTVALVALTVVLAVRLQAP
jgi:hypothetical protein